MRNLASYFASIVVLVAIHRVALAENLAFIYDDGQGNTMPYRLFLPPNHTPETDYPLVLYMHGAGERGTDNRRQLNGIESLVAATQSDRYASYLLAPQAQVGLGWATQDGIDLVAGVLNEVKSRYATDLRKTYVTGYSAGGYGTYAQLFDFPDQFAAGVPIAGGINPQYTSAEVAAVIKDIPLWIFHGELDGTIPVEYSRTIVAEVQAAGGSPLYTEYPDQGHGIRGLVYADDNDELYPWMFSQQLIPEPATWVLIGWGVVLQGLFRQRRKLHC